MSSPETPSGEQWSEAEQADRLGKQVERKFLLSWRTSSEQAGAANIARTADILYHSLFQPGKIESLGISPNEKYPDRFPTLTESLVIDPTQIPARQAFIEQVRRTLSNEVDYDQCVYPGAFETVRQLADRGHVTLWSAGDHRGFPERDMPGSLQQLKKFAVAGVGQLRRDEAERTGRSRQDLIDVAVGEDKFALLPGVLDKLAERKYRRAIILEDQLRNLVKAVDITKQHGALEPLPIWVRQDKNANRLPAGSQTLEEWKDAMNAIEDIQKAMPLINQHPLLHKGEQFGTVCDYDGVIANDTKREELQAAAILTMLQQEGWVTTA